MFYGIERFYVYWHSDWHKRYVSPSNLGSDLIDQLSCMLNKQFRNLEKLSSLHFKTCTRFKMRLSFDYFMILNLKGVGGSLVRCCTTVPWFNSQPWQINYLLCLLLAEGWTWGLRTLMRITKTLKMGTLI